MDGVSFGPAMIIGVVFMILGMGVSYMLKRKFKEYAKIPSQQNYSGKEIAEMMLHDHGINDVEVIHVPGQLTDHYNPMRKTVNLSDSVYMGRNAASAAVAAHECGHAIQHAKAYGPLKMRSKLVPIQNASGKILNIVMMASIFGGAFLYNVFPVEGVLIVIIAAYGAMALFSLITLPVEFDASKRALIWIENSGTATHEELQRSKKALRWAAMTYVVAAIGAVVTMLYYVMILLNRRR